MDPRSYEPRIWYDEWATRLLAWWDSLRMDEREFLPRLGGLIEELRKHRGERPEEKP